MANKNGFPTWLGILLILIIAGAIIYFGFIKEARGEGTVVDVVEVGGDFAEEGGFVEGIYDPDTGACLLPPERKGMILTRCCLNRQPDGSFVQVPCQRSTAQSFWLGGEFKTSDYCDTYSIYFRNTGEVVIDSADVTKVTIGAKELVSGNIVGVPSDLSTSWNYLTSNSDFTSKNNIAVGSKVLYGWILPMCYNDWAPDEETQYAVTVIAGYSVAGETGASQGTLVFTVDYASAGLGIEIE